MPSTSLFRLRLTTAALVACLLLLPLGLVSAQEASVAPPSALSSTVIAVDSPAAGSQWVVGQDVVISGWAADSSGPGTGIAAVYAYLDAPAAAGGLRVKEATYGKARPDVAATSLRSDWTNVGYELAWTVGNLLPGPHTLYIYADPITTLADSYITVPFTVAAAAGAPSPTTPGPTQPSPGSSVPSLTPSPTTSVPSGSSAANGVIRIIGPMNNEMIGRTVTVSILAADCAAATGATRVRLFRGSETGQLLGTSTEGLSRELAPACPGQLGSANILFNISLNTQSLPDGPLQLVAVADMSGGTVTNSTNLRVNNNARGNNGNVPTCNPYYPNYNAAFPTNSPCGGPS